MPETTRSVWRLATKMTAMGLGTAAVAAAFATVGAPTAGADVKEITPRPNVSSRQASEFDKNALRRSGQGVARGALADNRRADGGGIQTQGEVRDGVIAVPGTTSNPFGVRPNGQFRRGAPLGSW
ncbi:hypothetical protein SAMN04488581_4187 [Mycolicibacterium neoaurum]|uniref:hypothetical protein n=1 Tax=Mycolicibacterium neoaurum TaxID=1795 RepID=UPI0005628FD1|nr:hypothetical protein [Mycolicibacterium neoaurum]SDE50533.1 hypothetical protein SAMN04488581_4187 [Mycolicibacterium neoaurum]